MLPSLLLSARENLLKPWALAVILTMGTGGVLWLVTPRKIKINNREGVAVVGLGWISVVLLGSAPFWFTGVVPNFAGAVFESASGFTTTGATIFDNVEQLPASILLWRSVSHWIGGMGIIVLGVAILPLLGVGGAQLFRAEVPGISGDRLKPRIASTARALWGVYLLLTVVVAISYRLLGMSGFDAVNHSMSVMATGGFSTRTASMAAYSLPIQWVTIIAMFLAGTNFTLHFRMLKGHWTVWLKDIEWRWFFAITLVAVLIVFVALLLSQTTAQGLPVTKAVFNVVAIVTTTGFATTDFSLWPAVTQVILLGLMFMGAMGGSTGGGFKVVRAVVVAKHAGREIRQVIHPRAVIATKLGGRALRPEIILNVMALLALYIVTHAVGTLALAAFGHDLVTSTSAALAAISSIGPGLGAVGPAAHYGWLGWPEQLILAVLMLLGRLEFYTVLVLFMPRLWNPFGGNR